MAILTFWSPRLGGRIAHAGAIAWGWLTIQSNPLWRFSVAGREFVPRGIPVVYVANHASQLDIFALCGTGQQFKFVSKRSVFFFPVLGWAMWFAGYVPLARGDMASIRRMIETCARRLARGDSLLLYPEGTRSPDGKLREFKRGAFQLAHDAGVAIVPVVIRGTAQALPKGSLLCARSHISVTFLEPVDAATVKATDPNELCDKVHALIARELDATPT
ncbi:MAG: 1-acyl-sn-glycerol-3-phosphate acyltransferase [Planctomycetaceae bacterium]|nr:1-acyl-sn-glycerol-3-phosphate acyltransferase [Planctomycetaceae bacterium]